MLLPFQGDPAIATKPRAMPWAMCLLAFQAVSKPPHYQFLQNTIKLLVSENCLTFSPDNNNYIHGERVTDPTPRPLPYKGLLFIHISPK